MGGARLRGAGRAAGGEGAGEGEGRQVRNGVARREEWGEGKRGDEGAIRPGGEEKPRGHGSVK